VVLWAEEVAAVEAAVVAVAAVPSLSIVVAAVEAVVMHKNVVGAAEDTSSSGAPSDEVPSSAALSQQQGTEPQSVHSVADLAEVPLKQRERHGYWKALLEQWGR
jgi:hypothetical protein